MEAVPIWAHQLDDSVAIVEMILFQADWVVWNRVLGACQKWGNLDNGQAAAYLLMSKIHADGHLGYDMEK